jgi:hypothetical protein
MFDKEMVFQPHEIIRVLTIGILSHYIPVEK